MVGVLPSGPFPNVSGGARSIVARTLYPRGDLAGRRSFTLERVPLGCLLMGPLSVPLPRT